MNYVCDSNNTPLTDSFCQLMQQIDRDQGSKEGSLHAAGRQEKTGGSTFFSLSSTVPCSAIGLINTMKLRSMSKELIKEVKEE